MLIVLSPAKSLDFESPLTTSSYSIPEYLQQSEELVNILSDYSPEQLSKLMKISDKLAIQNVARYGSWELPFTIDNSRPAILSFTGDVYRGLDAYSMDEKSLQYAQKHLCILSGLYGLLKPLDLIQPYRLEMGTKLNNSKGKNLYEFWDKQLQKNVAKRLVTDEYPVLINLASKEYFTALDLPSFDYKVITPVFKDWKNGQYKMINFYAKKARGLMSRYAIDHQLNDPEALKNFNYEGYGFSENDSDELNWVFTRKLSQ